MGEPLNYKLQAISDLFINIPIAVGIFDSENQNILFLNNYFFDLTGYTKDEFNSSLIFGKDSTVFDHDVLCSNKRCRILRKDKEIRWVKTNAYPITISNKKYTICFFDDVTSEVNTESNLQIVSDNIFDSVSLYRVHGKEKELIFANDIFYKFIGISKEDYLINPDSYNGRLISEDDMKRTKQLIDKAIETGENQELDYRLFSPITNEELWMHRRFCVMHEDGKNHFCYFQSQVILQNVNNLN